MKFTKFIHVVISLSLCSACSLALAAKKPAPKVNTRFSVSVAKVSTMDVSQDIHALGSLSAINRVTLSAEVAGRVSAIFFKNGQEVTKGMPVAQLDNASDKAAYQSSLASLNLSRQKYQRAQLITQAFSQEQLDELKADVAKDQATVKTNQVALNQKQVIAPFTGVLGKFQVNVGDYVSAGQPIVDLVDTKQLRVNFSVPQQQRAQLKKGALVNIKVDAHPNKTFYGTVTYISPTVSDSSREIAVQADVPNPKDLLSPGMFVHASLQVRVHKNALVIPQQATLADITGYYVYVVNNNKVSKQYITTGEHVGNMIEVLKGLKAGQVVVTDGTQKLNDGALVKVVPSSPPAKSSS